MVGLYEPVAAAKLVLDESCTLKPEECRYHMMALAEIFQLLSDSQRLEIANSLPKDVFDSPYLDGKTKDEMILYRAQYRLISEVSTVEMRSMIRNMKTMTQELHEQLDRFQKLDNRKEDGSVVYEDALNKYYEFASTYGLLTTKLLACFPYLIAKQVEPITELFIQIAAVGYADNILEILTDSPAAQQLEPLIAGLRLYCGQEVRTAPEILEVAKDVVARIEERKREIEAAKK
jgi:hypothetical protein